MATSHAGRQLSFCNILTLSLALLCLCFPAFAQIVPETKGITLTMGGRILHPVRITSPFRQERLIGQRRLILKETSIIALQPANGSRLWSAVGPKNYTLRFMATEGDIAYLHGAPVYGKKVPDQLLRLDLVTGKWLAPLSIKRPVLAVLTGKGYVCVLTTTLRSGSFPDDQYMAAYQIVCFRGRETRPLWAKEYPAAREHGNSGVALWAARQPDSAHSSLQYLSWFNDNLLVCAGPKQDILALNKNTGQRLWEQTRVWEFQRGFVGPSVWSHYLSRFGEDQFQTSNPLPKRHAFDVRYECALIAGPIVVPRTKGEPHIFVAVSKAETGDYSDYLANCLVYELNEEGVPVGIVSLPRLVNGWEYQVQPNQLVWGCEHEALVKLVTSDEGPGFMPGSSDLLIRVAWYQQFAPYKAKAWLSSDPAAQFSAFSPGKVYRVHAGGFVLDNKAQVYQFPLSVIDTASGREQNLILRVPFTGRIPLPESNYRMSGSGAQATIETMGPYQLAITQLQREGSVLRITVSTEKWSAMVDFETKTTGPK